MSFYKRYAKSITKYIGQKFNKLLIIEAVEKTKKGTKVKCLCDCGNETIKYLHKVTANYTKSCGCARKENAVVQLVKANKNNPNMIKSKITDPSIFAAKKVYNKTYMTNTLDNLSFEDFLKLSQCDCFYCGAKPSNVCKPYAIKNSRYSKERQENTVYIYNGLDRIDNSLGHTKDNCVPCCLSCNKAKLTRTQKNFFEWIEKIYKLHFNKT